MAKNASRAKGALTAEEQGIVDDLGSIFNRLGRIIGHGGTREADLLEMSMHVHALQNAVLAQAAARLYPGQYRLMGESLGHE